MAKKWLKVASPGEPEPAASSAGISSRSSSSAHRFASPFGEDLAPELDDVPASHLAEHRSVDRGFGRGQQLASPVADVGRRGGMEVASQLDDVSARQGGELGTPLAAENRRQLHDVSAGELRQFAELAGERLHVHGDQMPRLRVDERGRNLAGGRRREGRRRAQSDRDLGGRREGRIRGREIVQRNDRVPAEIPRRWRKRRGSSRRAERSPPTRPRRDAEPGAATRASTPSACVA